MTREEFLLDMLEYYTVNSTRRCIDTAGCCSYSAISKYTEGCAIGRLLDKEDAQVLQGNQQQRQGSYQVTPQDVVEGVKTGKISLSETRNIINSLSNDLK